MVIYFEKEMERLSSGDNGISSERSWAISTLVWRYLIDLSSQDNVLIPIDFFEFMYHIWCAIHLHSVTNSGLIPRGQNVAKDRRYSFTSADPMNKEYKDQDEIDLNSCLVQAKRMEKTFETWCIGLIWILL